MADQKPFVLSLSKDRPSLAQRREQKDGASTSLSRAKSRGSARTERLTPPTTDTLAHLALIPLLIFAVFAQLDAVANRLSASLPIGLTELTLAAILGCTLLLLLSPPPSAGRAIGTHGVRLMLMLFAWAVFCWTLSAHLREGQGYLTGLGVAVVPALCVLVIVDRPARIQAMLFAIIGAGLISAAIVLVEARTGTRIVSASLAATTAGFDGVARSAGGSDENPTTAAQMLLVSVVLAAALLGAGERRLWPLLVATIAIGCTALVMTSARSATLGLVAAFGLILLSFRGHRIFPLLVIAGLVAAVGAIPFLPPTLVERFAAVGDFAQDQTLYRRITYLRIGTDLIQQSPIWGIGPGNFPLYYVDDAYRYLPGRIAMPRELHNTYLDTAAEYGLVGLAIFAALIGHALLAARRAFGAVDPMLRRTGFAVAVALAALLVACFFMPHKDLRYLWLLLALAIQCGRLRAGEHRP